MDSIKHLEMPEMLRVLGKAREKSLRDFCVVLFAFRFGLRASELSLLKLADVENGFVDCKRLKGSLHTRQAIVADSNPLLDVQTVLADYLRQRPDDGSIFLFTSRLGSGMTRRAMYNLFEDAAYRAGIEPGRRNIHICKHSLAVNLRKRGVPVDIVQRALGHADPGTTLKYYYHTSQGEATVAIQAAFAS